ncbi:MAG: hypothetical protein AAF385_06410 [Pseudomonadota bacterium]
MRTFLLSIFLPISLSVADSLEENRDVVFDRVLQGFYTSEFERLRKNEDVRNESPESADSTIHRIVKEYANCYVDSLYILPAEYRKIVVGLLIRNAGNREYNVVTKQVMDERKEYEETELLRRSELAKCRKNVDRRYGIGER